MPSLTLSEPHLCILLRPFASLNRLVNSSSILFCFCNIILFADSLLRCGHAWELFQSSSFVISHSMSNLRLIKKFKNVLDAYSTRKKEL